MMTTELRRFILPGTVVVLAGVAAAGWLRNPGGARANQGTAPYSVVADAYGNPVAAPVANYYAARPMNCVDPASVQDSPVRTVSDYSAYRPVRVVERRYVESPAPAARPVVKKKRSTAKSAAIVAGSAGVGAAIGGIAGGGKGAGIGALSGGAAGFIYDRLTR